MDPLFIYESQHNFVAIIEGAQLIHKQNIEKLNKIIRTHRIFNQNVDSSTQLQNYDAQKDEQINSITTKLNNVESSLKQILFNMESFIQQKKEVRRAYRINQEQYLLMTIDHIENKIEMVKYQYEQKAHQLVELADLSMKAIDVLKEHKTAAREFFKIFLLDKSRMLTESFYRTYNEEVDTDEEA